MSKETKVTFSAREDVRRQESGTARRAFLRGSGAAVLASATAGVGYAAESGLLEPTQKDATRNDAMNSDEAAVAKLYAEYAGRVSAQPWGVAELFAADGEVEINGVIHAGAKLRALYSGIGSGREMQTRVLQDHRRKSVEVAADGMSARGRFSCMMKTVRPLAGTGTIVEMARLQGQHAAEWMEDGVHEMEAVKVAGVWKIRRLVYRSGRRV